MGPPALGLLKPREADGPNPGNGLVQLWGAPDQQTHCLKQPAGKYMPGSSAMPLSEMAKHLGAIARLGQNRRPDHGAR